MTWIEPPAHVCAFKSDRLVVVAGSTKTLKQVTFSDGKVSNAVRRLLSEVAGRLGAQGPGGLDRSGGRVEVRCVHQQGAAASPRTAAPAGTV